jgi:hypothetical protein
MASEVGICNLALSHIGDDATVASIEPPEGSAQAEHCARFYPIVRDALLEEANWNFAMGRAKLAQLEAMPWPEWQYAYALPGDCMTAVAILGEEARSDYSTAAGCQQPRPFTIETQEDGSKVLFTNVGNAVLRYRRNVTDPTAFTPMFVIALSWALAAALAGAVIKGSQGTEEAKRCAQFAEVYLAKAKNSDANERDIGIRQVAPWMAGR